MSNVQSICLYLSNSGGYVMYYTVGLCTTAEIWGVRTTGWYVRKAKTRPRMLLTVKAQNIYRVLPPDETWLPFLMPFEGRTEYAIYFRAFYWHQTLSRQDVALIPGIDPHLLLAGSSCHAVRDPHSLVDTISLGWKTCVRTPIYDCI